MDVVDVAATRFGPSRTAALHALAALVLAGLTLAGVVRPGLGVVLAVSLALAALYHAAVALRAGSRRRAEADRLLVAIDTDRVPERLHWRARELTGRRERKALARALRNLLRSLELPSSLFPVPVNRRALARNRRVIESLVHRLYALDRPVRARGVLLVRQLLSGSPHSPLYDLDAAGELRAALVRARAEIEPR